MTPSAKRPAKSSEDLICALATGDVDDLAVALGADEAVLEEQLGQGRHGADDDDREHDDHGEQDHEQARFSHG